MKNTKRILALLLCVVMCVSLLPMPALADGTIEEEAQEGTIILAQEEELVESEEDALLETNESEKQVVETIEQETASEEQEETSKEHQPTEEETEVGTEADIREYETEETYLTSSGNCGDNLTWTLDDNGTLTISGTGRMTNYTSSESPFYALRSSIKKVVIEEDVTSIGNYAFYYCTSLTEVFFSDGITAIGEYAFYRCSKITEIQLPESLTSIEALAFSSCSDLTSLVVPGNVSSIGSGAFGNCDKLITAGPVGENYNYQFGWTTEIPAYAFSSCKKLTDIVFPEETTGIGNNAFSGCTSLSSFAFPVSITSIGSNAFSNCNNIKEVIFPEGLKGIGASAFNKCSNLKKVVIPQSVVLIGNSAFAGCSELFTAGPIGGDYNIEFGWAGSILGNAFYNCNSLTNVTIPDGVTTIGNYALSGCSNLIEIVIPGSIKAIGNCVFEKCNNLKEVYYKGSENNWQYVKIGIENTYLLEANFHYEPDGSTPEIVAQGTWGGNTTKWTLTDDGVLAFSGSGTMTNFSWIDPGWRDYRESIITVTFENGVRSIGDYAFSGCSSLISITIPDSVTSIGKSTFSGCSALTSITIPDSVTSVGDYAFNGCKALTSIALSKSITKLRGTFQDCTSLVTVTIPNGVTSIGEYTFSSCTSLTSVTIPDSVMSIGKSTFSGCSALTSITIPDSVTNIGEGAFWGCESLTVVSIPDSVTNLDKQVFVGCDALINVLIGNGITIIKEATFFGCRSLTNVTIGNCVTSIEKQAFSWCESLEIMTLPDCVTTIGEEAFYACGSLAEIIIPKSVKSIQTEAFAGCSSLKNITFEGEAPTFGKDVFNYYVRATAYYPAGDPTWTENIRQNYGGIISWVMYGKFALDKYKLELPCGEKEEIKPTLNGVPTNANWGTNDDHIATVNNAGEVTANKVGKTIITAEVNGEELLCEVVVLFKDVTDSRQFYYEPIYNMVDKGVIGGWEDGTFRPTGNCNRAAVVTFLWKLAGRPEPSKMATFSDMTTNADFNKAISWAAEEGITSGWSDNTFRPWNTCNRAAIVTFLWRYARCPEPKKMATFKDMTTNEDFNKAISWAAENGITTGWESDNTFRPWNTCNRLAVASFLDRYDKLG